MNAILKDNSIQLQEVLQEIFDKAWKASTALGLAKAASEGLLPVKYVDPDDVMHAGISKSFEAANETWALIESFAGDNGIKIRTPCFRSRLEAIDKLSKGESHD